jgi:peptidoglycan/xylan/chitin deacetylase (PgdA/CDA1 family)
MIVRASLTGAVVLIVSASTLLAREVAITIDDLPRGGDAQISAQADRKMTVKLLQPFQRDHIPLIGFVNECHRTAEVQSILRLWAKAGADLGNHTCSHLDLNDTSATAFEENIVKGEVITSSTLGHRPVYFRYPFLHAGKDAGTKGSIQDFLQTRGYRNAPVTLDNSDYMFAALYAKDLAAGDTTKAKLLIPVYLAYMESIFDFFEKRSIEVTGHEIKQILLIHASQLNADTMPDLLAMMRRRNYTFISLERALQDPAYQLPETYVGPGGFSWIYRWSITKGMKPKGEPDEPEWVRKQAGF